MSKDEVRETLDVRSETKTPWIEVRPEIIYNREHRGPRRRSFRCINQEGNPCFSHSNPLDSPVSCSLTPVSLFFGLSVSRLTSHVLRILALPVSCSLTPAALFFRLFVSRLTSHVLRILALPDSCLLTPVSLFFSLSVSRLTSHVSRSLPLGSLPCA